MEQRKELLRTEHGRKIFQQMFVKFMENINKINIKSSHIVSLYQLSTAVSRDSYHVSLTDRRRKILVTMICYNFLYTEYEVQGAMTGSCYLQPSSFSQFLTSHDRSGEDSVPTSPDCFPLQESSVC